MRCWFWRCWRPGSAAARAEGPMPIGTVVAVTGTVRGRPGRGLAAGGGQGAPLRRADDPHRGGRRAPRSSSTGRCPRSSARRPRSRSPTCCSRRSSKRPRRRSAAPADTTKADARGHAADRRARHREDRGEGRGAQARALLERERAGREVAAMVKPSVGRGLLRSALLGLLVAALAVLVNGTELFRAFELRTVDLRFRLRGSRPVKTPIAVVFIGDDSIAAYGRWPWSWDYHALLDRRAAAGRRPAGPLRHPLRRGPLAPRRTAARGRGAQGRERPVHLLVRLARAARPARGRPAARRRAR